VADAGGSFEAPPTNRVIGARCNPEQHLIELALRLTGINNLFRVPPLSALTFGRDTYAHYSDRAEHVWEGVIRG
jgi:hypothetical protein